MFFLSIFYNLLCSFFLYSITFYIISVDILVFLLNVLSTFWYIYKMSCRCFSILSKIWNIFSSTKKNRQFFRIPPRHALGRELGALFLSLRLRKYFWRKYFWWTSPFIIWLQWTFLPCIRGFKWHLAIVPDCLFCNGWWMRLYGRNQTAV